MSTRTLSKWHGAGNDFLVDVTTNEDASFWNPALAAAACHRMLGVGADGLLVAAVDGERVTMTLYNADGSIAEMSGNGARCLAAAVAKDWGLARANVLVDTLAGERLVAIELNGNDGYGSLEMGRVSFGETIPGTLGVAGVGNPHVVVDDDAVWTRGDRELVAQRLSEQVGGANVEFVTVLDPGHVSLSVYERGVGWTLACGTGSVASAAVLHRAGRVETQVRVSNPGGDLVVNLQGDQATLAGPVRFVADITWALS